MSKTKDGFYKQISGAIGNNNYLLLAGGGHIALGNNVNQVPLSNTTLNVGLNADMVDGMHADELLTYFSANGLSSSGNTLTLLSTYITVGGTTYYTNNKTASIINSLSISKLTSDATTNLTVGMTINGVVSSDKTLTDLYARYATQLLNARNITIGVTTRSFNGTANISWNLAEILGTSSIGSTTKPIYYNGTNFEACTYSVSANINSGTKNTLAYYSAINTISSYTANVGSGTKLFYLNSGVPTESNSTVGASDNPIFLNAGTLTASTSTIGTSTKPIYLNAGTLTVGSYELKATVNTGTINRIAWYSEANAISSGTITTDGAYLGLVSYLSVNTAHQTSYRAYINGNEYVNGKLETVGPVRITSNAGPKYILIGNQDSAGTNKPAIIEAANAGLYFGTGNNWSSDIGGTLTTTMFLSGDNKVGIGTTSPSYKLHIEGDIYTSSKIVFPHGGSSYVWDRINEGYNRTSIRAYCTAGESVSGAKDNYSIGLMVDGYYSFAIAGYGGAADLAWRNNSGTWYKIWNEYNDGSGSGLDADTIDGYHFSDLENRYVLKTGDTMVGTPYICMPSSAASISNNQPFGITYGRIQGYGDIFINGDTDGSTSEYVHITAGYGASTSGINNGLAVGYNNLYWKGGVLFANTSNVGIGTTSPSQKLHVEGNELVSGTSLMAYSIKILPTVYSELKTSYGLASDYESRYSTEEFLQSWVKYAYANGAGYTVQSYISPNSRGYIVADVYASGINSSTGYPEHITGRYYPHSGGEIIFGTSYGSWYYRTGYDDSYHPYADNLSNPGIYYWANMQLQSGPNSNTQPTFGNTTTAHHYMSGYLYMMFGGSWLSTIDNDGNGPIFGYQLALNNRRVYYTGSPVYICGGSYSNYANGITVDSNNNVGIGTTSPSYKLHVNGTSGLIGDTTIGSRSWYYQRSGRGALHHEFTGYDDDYGVMKIRHIHSDGSGGPGSYTATLTVQDERIDNISGNYEPTFYVNRIGETRVPDLLGVTVGGTRVFTITSSGLAVQSCNNSWLSPARVQIGRPDSSSYSDRSCIGTTNGNLHIDPYSGYSLYLNYYSNGNVYFNGSSYYINSDGSYYNGTSAYSNRAYSLLTNDNAQTADACYDATQGLHFYRFNGTGNTIGGGDGWIIQWSWAPGSVGGQIYIDDNPSGIIGIRGCSGSSGTTPTGFTSWWRIYTDSYHPYADSAGNADTVDGYHHDHFQVRHWTTQRDFADGTLIYTDINYSNSSGDPFYGVISGNTYGRIGSAYTTFQGYLWSDTIINYSVSNLGIESIGDIIAMNISGNLCFWFPRQSYWEGYSVEVYSAYDYRTNRVTNVVNSGDPGGSKRVNLNNNTYYNFHNGNSFWANVQVSNTSSTSTWPTFGSAYSYDWWRSYNATGWYNESYGGGIWMTDSSWIRTYGSKNFYVEGGNFAVSGNAGIGTTTPAYKLHVNGNTYTDRLLASTTSATALINTAYNNFAINFREGRSYDTGFYYGTYGNEFLALTTQQSVTSLIFGNGYDPASITSGSFITNDSSNYTYGNSTNVIQIKQNCVNIGDVWFHNVSPDYKLKVNGTSQLKGEVWIGAHGSSASIGTGYANNDTNRYNYITFYGSNSDGDIIYTGGTWTGGDHISHRFDVNSCSYAMVIRNITGNVGIGTSSPSQKLHVAGNQHITGFINLNDHGYLMSGRSSSFNYGYSLSLGDSSNSMGMFSGPGGEEGAVIVSPDTCVIYNSFDQGWGFQVFDKDRGGDLTTDNSRVFGVNQANYFAWSRGGFWKEGSSDSYVLLGGGGHAAISSLSVNYANYAGWATRLDGGAIAGWGYLTSGNGFSGIAAYDWGDKGAFCWAGKGGQMYMQVDGFFYQNEGQYRVIDESGGTFSGNIHISHATGSDMGWWTSNPMIKFSEYGSQQVGIVYTDYDAYRPAKGLKVMDVNNDDIGNVWLEVQGCLYVGQNAYSYSDMKLKYDIRDILNKDVVDLFNTDNGFIRHFKWKDNNKDSYGVIAQEIQEYCPEAIDYSADILHVNYNIIYGKMIGAMFKKIKELESMIKTQNEIIQKIERG